MPLHRVSAALPPGRLTLRFYTSQSTPLTIGIRREDPRRVWERRAPLTPDAVAGLVGRDNVRVLIQECERRVFPLEEYIRVRTIYVRDPEFIIEYRDHTGGCGGTPDA
jgi:alpha-aminoadipic semialdehyde synthase